MVLGGTTIGSWRITPTYQSCKKWHPFPSSPTTGIPSASAEERLQERQNEGCVPECTTSCGLCCPRRGSSAKPLRGARDGLIWEQVLGMCVFLLWFCYVDPWAEPSPSISALLHLMALYLFCFMSVSSLLCIGCLFCIYFWSSNRERGSAKQLLDSRSCIWHQSSGSLRNVSIAPFTLISLLLYFINPTLSSPFWLCLWFAHLMGNSCLMRLEERKKQGLQFLRGILLLAFRAMGNHVHCIQ